MSELVFTTTEIANYSLRN